MTRPALVAIVAVLLATLVVPTTPAGAQGDRITWWALGDSYSSGEGIPGTEPPAAGKPECARASGNNTNAKAWAVVARETLAEPRISSWAFTPCTGAISSDVEGQMNDAAATSQNTSADIVTLSMGGNDILFGDVVRSCIDLEVSWSSIAPGCNVGEATLRRRIDMLVGRTPAEQGQYTGITLPKLYDDIATRVRPGGAVVVLGYPQIVEEVARWDRWRRDLIGNCEGVQSYDVGMLRSVAGYLNEQIALAVQAADQRWSPKGIRFHWRDIATGVYETGDDANQRHALCAEDPWLNGTSLGVTSGDWRYQRSFHPKQVGHSATGTWLGNWMRTYIGLDGMARPPAPPPPPAPEPTLTVEDMVVAFVQGVIAGEDVSDLATPEAIAEAEALANDPSDPMDRGQGYSARLGVDYTDYSSTGDVCGLVSDITGECLVAAFRPDGSFTGLYLVTYTTFRPEDGIDYVDGEYFRNGQPVEPGSYRPQVVGISDIRG